VLYWFWSHIQLTQKKVQLLENAVFELRGLMTRGDPGVQAPSTPPAPVYQDLADDEEEWSDASAHSPSKTADIGSTPLSALSGDVTADLQPGGRLEVPSPGTPESAPVTTDDQFRELFLQRSPVPTPPAAAAATAVTASSEKTVSTGPAPAPAPAAVSNEALEAMPVKDLRRLAEQRGLTGVSEMRKKEILSALRQQIPATAVAESVPVASEPQPSTTVVVERTLDLTEGIEEATVLE
jgi:hypothetical protein